MNLFNKVPLELPTPGEAEQQHLAAMAAHLQGRLDAAGGALPFSDFMHSALYAPGLGYYSAGLRKFGASGDFVTAPEISPLFSRCLARQCADVLEAIGGGAILEFGAGSGAMARDLLLELKALGRLPETYYILDLSPDLRERQRATLAAADAALLARVQWLDALPEPGFRGCILANEVLDAMPVALFEKQAEGLQELTVTLGEEALTWGAQAASAPVAEAVAAIEAELGPLPEGYRSELNLYAAGWTQALAEVLEAGMALLIDYGYTRADYYRADRTMGTLMCHYRHRAHADPLVLPGLQDITSYVDFTSVAEAAHGAGLHVAGFAAQAQFLIGCGITELLSEVASEDYQQQMALAQQVKTLTLPGEMGERFKVLALTRDLAIPLRGFLLQDLRNRL